MYFFVKNTYVMKKNREKDELVLLNRGNPGVMSYPFRQKQG